MIKRGNIILVTDVSDLEMPSEMFTIKHFASFPEAFNFVTTMATRYSMIGANTSPQTYIVCFLS